MMEDNSNDKNNYFRENSQSPSQTKRMPHESALESKAERRWVSRRKDLLQKAVAEMLGVKNFEKIYNDWRTLGVERFKDRYFRKDTMEVIVRFFDDTVYQ